MAQFIADHRKPQGPRLQITENETVTFITYQRPLYFSISFKGGLLNIRKIVLLIITLLVMSTVSFAASFGNTETSTWADTPQGIFECSTTKDERQVLTIGGKEIYRTPDNLMGDKGKPGTKLLSEGIYLNPMAAKFASACPDIIDNKAGYVVYEYPTAQPISNNPFVIENTPYYDGLMRYSIIKFNEKPPTRIGLLMEAKSREGEKYQPRFTWDDKCFVLRYYGFPYDGMFEYPKPQFHTIRFDFATKQIKPIKLIK